MKSPLAVDQETVKKYKIPPEVELHPRQKLAFLEEQLQQIKAMHWRSRVDVLHATRMTESSVEAIRNKGLQNITTHTNEVEQTIGAIQMLNQLIAEVRKENPNLGGISGQDHPEGA